jgi:hypothetical protein
MLESRFKLPNLASGIHENGSSLSQRCMQQAQGHAQHTVMCNCVHIRAKLHAARAVALGEPGRGGFAVGWLAASALFALYAHLVGADAAVFRGWVEWW